MRARPLLIALPLVAGASWAGATAYSSAQSRGAYEQLVEQLDTTLPMQVTNLSYIKGFMESTAVTAFRLNGNEAGKEADDPGERPDDEPLFVLHHVISHSPVQLRRGADTVAASHIQTTLDAADLNIESAPLARALGSVAGPLLEMHSSVGFNGDTANALHVSAIDYTDDEISVAIAASNYTLDFGADGSLAGAGGLGGGTLEFANGERLVMSPTSDVFDLEHVADGLYVGELRANLASLELVSHDFPQAIRLADVVLAASSSIEAERYRSTASLQAGTVDTPFKGVTAAELDMTMTGIDAAGLQEFQAAMQELQQVNLDTVDEDTLLKLLRNAYLPLITPGAALEISSGLDNDGGNVQTSVTAEFVGDGSASGRENIVTVGDLLRALKLGLSATADADAIALTPAVALIGTLQQRRFVIRDGDTLKSDISLVDLVADINGAPLSLELMLGDLLAQPLGQLIRW